MPRRYSGIAKDILTYLAIAGVVIIAATSPYFLFGLLKQLGKKSSEKKKLRDAFSKLQKSRLVILQEKDNSTFLVKLTERGKQKVKEIQFQDISIPRPPRWDRIWRIVIFDIPNKKKHAREALREKLKQWNFYQLQESVWVCPWPCEKEIDLLVELFGIFPYVNMIEAGRIKNDVKLKSHFKLL